MEGRSHRVVEGMLIAQICHWGESGLCLHAGRMPSGCQRMQKPLDAAKSQGLLGENILGSGFNFDIVNQEEQELLCSFERKVLYRVHRRANRVCQGQSLRFPAQSGLWGYPTLINNIETFANVLPVIHNGADWFRTRGAESKARHQGLCHYWSSGRYWPNQSVPLGKTLEKSYSIIGRGVRNNRKFKAVQIGGPSSGCLTEEHLDHTLGFRFTPGGRCHNLVNRPCNYG